MECGSSLPQNPSAAYPFSFTEIALPHSPGVGYAPTLDLGNVRSCTVPTQGLAERRRRPPAFKSARSVSNATTEMTMPNFRSEVRPNRTVIRCAPGESDRIICAFVSAWCGVTVLPFTSTRHAGQLSSRSATLKGSPEATLKFFSSAVHRSIRISAFGVPPPDSSAGRDRKSVV